MEVRVSSQKPGLLTSDFVSDSEKKEISEGEDEDDDRNHKHRKRGAHSQSFEGDSIDQVLTRPYRKRNKPFENGYPNRGADTQSGETWKFFNVGSGREFPSRFEKRRPNQAPFSRAPMDLNQRISRNQVLPSEAGPVRGRGRELGAWGLHDSILGSVDLASPMVQPGLVPSSLFAGRGLPNISNAHNTSWNAFGLVPGVPNGGLDALHPLGLQASLGASISPSMNIGIPRQRCRDFEERGFCLRGDMCPMEHGVNRIVIDDVQGLSQFNLPVSLPGSQLLGTSAGQGALPVITASSGSLVNAKAFHAKSSMPGMNEDGLGPNGGFVGCSLTGGSDVYDPDQPLWSNDNPETSAFLTFNQSNADETESFMNTDPADRPNTEAYEGFDECPVRSAAAAGSQSSSVWGRIGSSKNRLELKEKIDSIATSPSCLEQDIKSEGALNTDLQYVSRQGKQVKVNDNGPQVKELSLKSHSDFVRNVRKPSQKALRTLFVNGIPSKDNKMEALLSHFRKFGEVIDIYIPMHGEQAFVQFSRREEAEAALKAPDAVMGNRFIKLWWANRDNIPDDGINGSSSVSMTPHGVALNPSLSHPSVSNKRKENPLSAGGKDGSAHASASQGPVYDRPKLVITNGPKAPPLQQKKMESLEVLKGELRKKQEMLDQKRNEFRRQLDKLERQATGFKDVSISDQAATRLKGETPPDHAQAEIAISSPRANIITENAESVERDVPHISTSSPTVVVWELSSLTHSIRPLAPLAAPFVANRFKLDNRPTAFKIVSPLPAGLAHAATLEEHFSVYGDLSSVELEESQLKESNNMSAASDVSAHISLVELEESQLKESNDASLTSDVSAHISFTTRRSAEKAFLHGKCWKGHNLQFIWLPSNNSGKESGGSGNLSAYSKIPAVANIQHNEEAASTHSQKIAALGNGEPIQHNEEAASTHSQKITALGNGEPIQHNEEAASTHSQKIAALGNGEPENMTITCDAKSADQDEDSKST